MRNIADARYRLAPTDQKQIIQCVVGSCLAVCAFFAFVHTLAVIAAVMA